MAYPAQVPVDVTQDHIGRGVPGVSQRCPLALAFLEVMGKLLGGELHVSVWYTAVIYGRYPQRPYAMYSIPPEAYDFVVDFDAGGTVTPTTFVFTLLKEESE
jgi:hypothetical protein